MAITFNLTGDAYEKLDKIIAACSDGKPAMNTIGRVLSNRIKLGFKNSKSPYGQKWKPLISRQGQPLVNTGRLRESITYIADDHSVQVGTNLIQAKVHQFGAVIRPRTAKTLRFMIGNRVIYTDKAVIPARPYLPILNNSVVLPDSWFNATVKEIQKHIERGL